MLLFNFEKSFLSLDWKDVSFPSLSDLLFLLEPHDINDKSLGIMTEGIEQRYIIIDWEKEIEEREVEEEKAVLEMEFCWTINDHQFLAFYGHGIRGLLILELVSMVSIGHY